MSSKALIIGGVIFIIVLMTGAYFLIGGNGGSSESSVKILSYTTNDIARPKAKIRSTAADLGKMKVSDEKDASFTITNAGQKPLQLYDITSSCMCTFGQIILDGKASEEFGMHGTSNYAAEIAPGQQAILKVIYRPYLMPVYGSVEREVYMATNDPQNTKLVFKVNAYVQ